MQEFSYTARDNRGEVVQGTVQAENSALAVGKVQAMGLKVDRVRVLFSQEFPTAKQVNPESSSSKFMKQAADALIYPVVSGVPPGVLAIFYRQFATLINAGMPLYQSLMTLEKQTHNARLQQAIHECQRRVEMGGRLSEALAMYPHIFSSLQLEMIRAAEQGGMLETMLERISEYLEQEQAMRQMISRLTLYPKLVLGSAVLILGKSAFTGGGMPAVSKLILGGSFGSYLMETVVFVAEIAVVIFAAVALCRVLLFRSPQMRVGYERIKLAMPGLGDVVKKVALARFGRAFGALYSAGIPLSTAVRIAGQASGSYAVMRDTEAAALAAERGLTLSETFRQSGFFSPVVVDMLHTGEQTGNMDTMMVKVAEYLEGEAETKAHRNAHIFSVVLYLIIAVMIGYSIINQWGQIAGNETTLPNE